MDSQQKKAAGIGCCCVVFVIGIIIFACSFATLHPREYAVTYNSLFKSVNRRATATNGRNIIGPNQQYIVFPRGLVGFYFNDVGPGTDTASEWESWMDWQRLSVWSKNGQTVNIGIDMKLNLKKDGIPSMYLKYGRDPWSQLRVSLVATIKNAAVAYETLEFFVKRIRIKEYFEQQIREMLLVDDCFDLNLFNLRSVDLPDKFESVILRKLLSFQAYQRARHQQNVAITEKGVAEVLARGEADALISLQAAKAYGDYEIVQKKAEGDKEYFKTRADQHGELMAALDWVGDTDLSHSALHFYSWQNVQQRSSAEMVPRVGVSEAKLVAPGHTH